MKFAIVLAALVAMACADLHKPADASMAELEAIITAIQSPSTDPATAAMLEQQLADLLADFIPQPAPIIVEETSPIHVGPAIIDFPLPDGGAITADQPAVVEAPAIVPAPVLDATPAAVPNAAAPLVQIILNINQASFAPVAPAPVETPVVDVHPVQVVDEAVNVDTIVPSPVLVVDAVPSPVLVVDAVPEPVQVVDVPVVEVEPIQIGTPVIPTPVVVAPIDILN